MEFREFTEAKEFEEYPPGITYPPERIHARNYENEMLEAGYIEVRIPAEVVALNETVARIAKVLLIEETYLTTLEEDLRTQQALERARRKFQDSWGKLSEKRRAKQRQVFDAAHADWDKANDAANEALDLLRDLGIKPATKYREPGTAPEGEHTADKPPAELSAEKAFLAAFVEKDRAREAHTDAFFAFRDYWKYDSHGNTEEEGDWKCDPNGDIEKRTEKIRITERLDAARENSQITRDALLEASRELHRVRETQAS